MTAPGSPAPLRGRRILLTRRPEQSAALASQLVALGASVIEVPTLELAEPGDTGPLDRALASLHRYDWLVFTSANAVRAVRQRLDRLGIDAGPVGRATPVGSVGASTSETFREQFPDGEVSLEPAQGFRAETLAEAFRIRGCAGQRLLFPASDRARDVLPRTLAALGAEVEVVVAYRTVEPAGLAERVSGALRGGFDLAVFASPSAVDGFVSAAGERAHGLPAAVIGPVTEAAARRAGLAVCAVASPSTGEGLLRAIVEHLSENQRTGSRP